MKKFLWWAFDEQYYLLILLILTIAITVNAPLITP